MSIVYTMPLPQTFNKLLPINIKDTNAITGTYGGVSILNNGKTELKSDTTITRLGVNKNVDGAYQVDVSGNVNVSTSIMTPRLTSTNGVSATLLTTQSGSISVASGVMSFTATNPEATFQSFKTQFFGAPFTITSVSWASIANMPINGVWTFYLQNATSGDITIKNNVVSSGTANTYLHTDYPADIVVPNAYNIAVIKIERGETSEAYFTANKTSNATGGAIPSIYVDLVSNETIGGTKTFSSLPQSSATPTLSNQLITKTFADSTYVDLTNNETVGGIKTFTVLPQSSATPTLSAQLITKEYADTTYTGSAILSSTNTWTGATNTFTNSLIANNLLPYFPSTSSSYKIGLNAMLRQQASATNNIAIGENALLGYATTPAWNQTKRNIAIGFNTGKNLYYDSGTVASDDNVIIGYNAGSNMFYSSRQNVLIGSNCGSSNNYIQKCVFLGHNIASTGSYFLSDCVIIGANSLQSVSDKSGIVCVGSGNLPVFSGNSPICVGVGCGTSSLNNNRGIWLGGNCGNNVNSNLGSYFIGNGCGNNLTTGGSCCFMGNDSNTGNGAMVNTFVFGYEANCSTDDTFFIGGNNVFSNKTMTPVVRNRNRLCFCDTITASTLNLNFQDSEYIVLSTNATTTINLPNPSSVNNIGTKYTIIRAYSPSVAITINATSGIQIQYGNNFSNSMIVPVAFFTIVCINSSGTAWVIVNSQFDDSAINSNITTINGDITGINGQIDSLEQKTQGIGYTNASGSTNISEINTDVDTSPQLTIGYGGSLPSETTVNGLLSIAGAQYMNGYQVLSGSPNNLAKPLKEYYALSTVSTGALTLPVIDSSMYGSQITFVKSSAVNTWTINAGSGNTFRLYKSDSTATAASISLALNNTVLRIVATANVWDVIETDLFATPSDWVLGPKYVAYKTFPTTITNTAVNWNTSPPTEFCKYILFSNSGTGTTTLTLPQISNSAVFEGMEFVFRRTNTTASATTTSTLTVERGGSSDLIYISGAMTTAINTFALGNGVIYGKIVCVGKAGGRWAYFPS